MSSTEEEEPETEVDGEERDREWRGRTEEEEPIFEGGGNVFHSSHEEGEEKVFSPSCWIAFSFSVCSSLSMLARGSWEVRRLLFSSSRFSSSSSFSLVWRTSISFFSVSFSIFSFCTET